jgi:uncharacterized membrane protein YfcA
MSFEIIWLAVVFCIIAFFYSSVGFGGGSSYTAVLALAGFSAAAIPVVALSCNLVVATGGAIRFIRMGHFPWKRMMPLFLLSIPFAYLAGRYKIPPSAYFILLGFALAAAAFLLWRKRAVSEKETLRPLNRYSGLGIGAGLGTLSGLTGIGGGIYLSPVLMLRKWATPKEAAATASIYIVMNSIAGLLGQLSKPGSAEYAAMILPLGGAVLLGGTLGSRLGSRGLSPVVMQKGTALLVGLVALRILFNSIELI